MNKLKGLFKLLEKNPLLQRGYSNLIVLEMYSKLKEVLPDEITT